MVFSLLNQQPRMKKEKKLKNVDVCLKLQSRAIRNAAIMKAFSRVNFTYLFDDLVTFTPSCIPHMIIRTKRYFALLSRGKTILCEMKRYIVCLRVRLIFL